MSKFSEKVKLIFSDVSLRNRIFFVLGALAVSRLFAIIPIPGIDTSRLQSLFAGSEFLNLLNIFSGGGLSNLSIVMLGVGPFITASIIMQLMTVMVPKLKALYHEEGEAGRRRFAQYSRILTIPLAIVQGYAFIRLLQGQNILLMDMVVIVAGSMLLMWLGELITEFGVGNGVSLIIFAGIVSRLPQAASQLIVTFDISQLPIYIAGLAVALLVTLGVVVVTEAERPIPITYAKQVRGGRVYGGLSTYLPLRVNQAGVIPIIFALSILLFPQMIFQFLTQSTVTVVADTASFALTLLSNSWFYTSAYFLLVFFFTYFYTAVTFDPDAISTNLQKSGAFVPGVRPGEATSDYIGTRFLKIGSNGIR